MTLDPSLKDLYYLSILFKSMKGLFEIKWLSLKDDKLDFAYEVLSQIPLFQNSNLRGFFTNRVIIVLEFNDVQSNEGQSVATDKMPKILIQKGVIESGIFSDLTKKSISDQKISKEIKEQPQNVLKQEIKPQIKTKTQSDENLKNDSKKEGSFDFNLKNVKFIKTPMLVQRVKLAIETFKETKNLSHPASQNEILDKPKNDFEASLKFIISTNDSIKEFCDKMLIIRNLKFEDSFNQALKNQTHILANNQIEDVVPFATVGYHFKEDEKKSYRRKKKKQKVLFKRELNYLSDEKF